MSDVLSARARMAVLAAAIAGLLFDGVELGMMPISSLSVSKDLLGDRYTPALGGDWFARFTAALMLGAAVGGIFLGYLGDLIGRSKALGVSVLFYSVFAGLGALVQTQEQMLLLRFLVGLGVGGVWPNAVALASECWPNKSRPMVAGLLGASLNGGILLLSQIVRLHPVTPQSWRWIYWLAAAPAVLGLAILIALPESPLWKLQSKNGRKPSAPMRALFTQPILRSTLIGILLGSIPMVGAWAASKWMMPWSDQVGGAQFPQYKGSVQACWAFGAVLGSFFGAQIAAWLGLRRSYAWISFGAACLTLVMFTCTAPLQTSFLPIVFLQGFVTTLFFGWLPLYLPQLFPTSVRAAGTGIAYNVGRFATAIGVLFAGLLFTALGGSYAKVGAACGLIYGVGLIAIYFVKDIPTEGRELH